MITTKTKRVYLGFLQSKNILTAEAYLYIHRDLIETKEGKITNYFMVLRFVEPKTKWDIEDIIHEGYYSPADSRTWKFAVKKEEIMPEINRLRQIFSISDEEITRMSAEFV